ncbi:MAG TPA: MFS transporter [Actinomycetota bacterium]|nr:MFS transporter [Actinomycetota bacterium]
MRPSGEGPAIGADARTTLRANRDFKVVVAGQALSALGDAISITAMPLLILSLTGSGALMGLVGALQVAPDLIVGVAAGALADRWDRRRMMFLADLGRAVLTFLIPLSFWLGLPVISVIIIVAVPANLLRVVSDAAYTSSIPKLVGRDNLARANSYMEATLSIPFIVSPALAGILVSRIGGAATIAIDAVSFGLSAASLLMVRRSLRADRTGPTPRLLVDIREGITFVWRTMVLRLTIAYWSVMTIASAALLPALAFYLTVDRGLGPQVFGLLGSAWSVGYLCGSLLAGRLGGTRLGLRMAACGVVTGAALLVVTRTRLPRTYLSAAFVLGGALAIQLVAYMTLRASATPDELLGRVGSTSRTISVGLRPLGLLAGGALMDATTGGTALMGMAAVSVGASTLFALIPKFRDAGAADTPAA